MGIFAGLRQKIFQVPELKKGLLDLDRARNIPELSEFSTTQTASYEIIAGLVSATVQTDSYKFSEPVLNDDEKHQYELILGGLYEIVNFDITADVDEYLEKSVRIIIAELDLRISEDSMRKILYYVYRNLIGFGKLEPLLKDSLIQDIEYHSKITVNHRVFGRLNTSIVLSEEELLAIFRRASRQCNQEFTQEEDVVECSMPLWSVKITYKPQPVTDSEFMLHKKITQPNSPLQLLKDRKISPEAFAFLWMAIEDKQNIFIVNDKDLLYAMSYFLPPHSRVLTNMDNYYPNVYTKTYLGESLGEEDYALIQNFSGQNVNGAVIASMDFVQEEGNIVCYDRNYNIK